MRAAELEAAKIDRELAELDQLLAAADCDDEDDLRYDEMRERREHLERRRGRLAEALNPAATVRW
jgi:hypothetical protein